MRRIDGLLAENEELRRLLANAIATIEDFMPNIGRCTLQDYGHFNDVLCASRRILIPEHGLVDNQEGDLRP